MITLGSLAVAPRWCAWRVEQRNGRATKLPLRVDGSPARVNVAADWVVRPQAEEAAKALVNGAGGGVGILLGPIGDVVLAGVDLDSCRDGNGEFAPWARAALAALGPTYAELSPSRRGVKAYFLVRTSDLDAARAALGMTGTQHGRKWAAPGGDHAEAIETYLGRRWFAVTEHIISPTERLAVVMPEALGRLRAVAEQAFGTSTRETIQSQKQTAPGASPASGGDAAAHRDESRSARAFRVAARMKGTGASYADFVAALQADEDLRRWAETKGAALDGRELKRAWERAPAGPGDLSEDEVALVFASRFEGEFIHDHDAGHWLEWTGSHWAPARTPTAFHAARELARELAAGKPKAKKSVSRAAFVAAVERLAAADPVFARHAGQFDHDPWLLATPGGTVDLRTGKLRPADRSDMITQCAGTAPAETANCPRWLQFMDEITCGDRDVAAFLQRSLGYTLTGVTSEHVFWFLSGSGRNGKSTFLNVVKAVLGGYARVTAFEVFAQSAQQRHPTELAALRGGRIVICNETQEGCAWNEARIKSLTGGDPITARFLYRNFFTFEPSFKTWVVGNHAPRLQNVDEAMRRRLRLVPFNFTPANPDKLLETKLRAELPGILRWIIEGCLAWQAQGLDAPRTVLRATDSYLAEQDAFAAWAAERLVFLPTAAEKPSVLLADFNAWATRIGEPQRTRFALKSWIERHPGLTRRTREGQVWVVGCALRRETRQEWP